MDGEGTLFNSLSAPSNKRPHLIVVNARYEMIQCLTHCDISARLSLRKKIFKYANDVQT